MMLLARLGKLERKLGTGGPAGRCFGFAGSNYSSDDITAFLASHGISRDPADMVICVRGFSDDSGPVSIGWLGPAPQGAEQLQGAT